MNPKCPEELQKHCNAADDAAESAVKKVFAILGVDIDKPESVEEFRQDLRFGKKMRKAADHGFIVFIGTIVIVMVGLIGAGALAKIKGG